MSVDRNLYVGPYILIEPVKKEVSFEELRCSNAQCKNHLKEMSTPYCPVCGSPTIVMQLKEIEEVTAEDLLYSGLDGGEEAPDALYSTTDFSALNGYSLMIPDVDIEGGVLMQAYGEDIVDLVEEKDGVKEHAWDIEESMENFKKVIEKDLERLRAYGFKNFIFKYGVVFYLT